jgi:hypothetical protein
MNNILPSLHLYITKVIHIADSIYLFQIDMNKTSHYTIKRIYEYDSNVSNGFIKCFMININNLNLKLNNVEVMTTLEFKPTYNNFIVKTITVLNKNQNKNNNNKYQSLNNKIYKNINSIKTL